MPKLKIRVVSRCCREPHDTLRSLFRVPEGVALASWQQDILDHEKLLKEHIGEKLQYEAASSLRQLVTSFMDEMVGFVGMILKCLPILPEYVHGRRSCMDEMVVCRDRS